MQSCILLDSQHRFHTVVIPYKAPRRHHSLESYLQYIQRHLFRVFQELLQNQYIIHIHAFLKVKFDTIDPIVFNNFVLPPDYIGFESFRYSVTRDSIEESVNNILRDLINQSYQNPLLRIIKFGPLFLNVSRRQD